MTITSQMSLIMSLSLLSSSVFPLGCKSFERSLLFLPIAIGQFIEDIMVTPMQFKAIVSVGWFVLKMSQQ